MTGSRCSPSVACWSSCCERGRGRTCASGALYAGALSDLPYFAAESLTSLLGLDLDQPPKVTRGVPAVADLLEHAHAQHPRLVQLYERDRPGVEVLARERQVHAAGIAQHEALVVLHAGRVEQRGEPPALLVGVARHRLPPQGEDRVAGQGRGAGRRLHGDHELGRIAAATAAVIVLAPAAALGDLDPDRRDV